MVTSGVPGKFVGKKKIMFREIRRIRINYEKGPKLSLILIFAPKRLLTVKSVMRVRRRT